MSVIDYADPFWGNGEIDLPEPSGIAATWMFLKAQTGNTHPGATLPFGMVSVCSHSGAYPTGYGVNGPSTHGSVPKAFERNCANGFAHFHHSGTGMVGIYYNFCKVTPLLGKLTERNKLHDLDGETASPGYYQATLSGTGIVAELTTTRTSALHRYVFPKGRQPKIVLDASAGGIDFDGMRMYANEVRIQITSQGSAEVYVMMDKMPFYIYVETDIKHGDAAIWVDDRPVDGVQWGSDTLADRSFGLIFSSKEEQHTVHVRLGFSLRSMRQARGNLGMAGSFDETRVLAAREWEEILSRIEVDADERTKGIFYSALYHSLIKPANFHGESPFWQDDAYYTDFITLWDQYKTQLPLVMTLYPEHGREIVNSLLNQCEYSDFFPNMITMSGELHQTEEQQARGLAYYPILDAYFRGIDGVDWSRALDLMLQNLHRENNNDFIQDGLAYPLTHTLDLAGACHCIYLLATSLGREEIAVEAHALSRNWKNAYDVSGLLREGAYYEGTRWNYSFRLLHDMAGRIDICGKDRFIELLDQFFGYGADPVRQMTGEDSDYHQYAYDLGRFEGLNNEPDMEVPYAYIYAGRHDRTAEICRAGMRDMFTTGRGGAPGNVDSGSLSSWYVWNALGLFPVAGQPLLLIGSPIVSSAKLKLADTEMLITVKNQGDENIYVQSALLNGQILDRAYLSITELMAGGELELVMGRTPSDWAQKIQPRVFSGKL